jgi:hypothetical protein
MSRAGQLDLKCNQPARIIFHTLAGGDREIRSPVISSVATAPTRDLPRLYRVLSVVTIHTCFRWNDSSSSALIRIWLESIA